MKGQMLLTILFAIAMGFSLSSCSEGTILQDEEIGNQQPDDGNDNSSDDDGSAPDFDDTIAAYNGEKADDAAADVVGTDEDLYWEANSFTETVTVAYKGTTATAGDAPVLTHPQLSYLRVPPPKKKFNQG